MSFSFFHLDVQPNHAVAVKETGKEFALVCRKWRTRHGLWQIIFFRFGHVYLVLTFRQFPLWQLNVQRYLRSWRAYS